ncbi:acyl-CoA dehydrogenase NM domain-like protein [Gloeopeniophorella convolvens]|nr:acyl-CoA dehydrogenase NM domain-like protein [Gloeopeniophorella convolvens]
MEKLSRELAQSALFSAPSGNLAADERARLAYSRAKAIARLYALTTEDILHLSAKFWSMHADPVSCLDRAATTLLTLQYNLCAGTIATFAHKQPSVRPVLERVLDFSVSGQFCLTEIGHGLDAIHLETTATVLPDGSFLLNTPSETAAKYMPPTVPIGIPCIAVVFAKTIVNGDDHGVKPFIVEINDGTTMAPGIISKLLPYRGGSCPINHSLTYFKNIRLPRTALLGSLEKPSDARAAFFSAISRVEIGALALGAIAVPALQLSAHIAARYSQRRTVVGPDGVRRQILSFATQRVPVLRALAQAVVMRAFLARTIDGFCAPGADPRVRHALATLFKVTATTHAQAANLELSERCGAQGLFGVNQITTSHADLRGISVAEGDLLGISIRLASELLLGRYSLPPSTHPDSLLAQHEADLFAALRTQLAAMTHHRSAEYDRAILPESLPLVQALGQRLAHDAARAAGVDDTLVEMYVAGCVRDDEAWYVERLGLSRADVRAMEGRAAERVMPRLEEHLVALDVEAYVTAPIVSDARWAAFVEGLPTFGGAQSADATRTPGLARL